MKTRPFTLRCVCQVERTEKNCLSSEPASVRLTHEMRKEKKWLVDARSVSKLMISVFFLFLWRRRFSNTIALVPRLELNDDAEQHQTKNRAQLTFLCCVYEIFNFLVFLLSQLTVRTAVRYEFGFCSTSLCLHDSGALNAQFWALCIRYSPTHNSVDFSRSLSSMCACLFDSYDMRETLNNI